MTATRTRARKPQPAAASRPAVLVKRYPTAFDLMVATTGAGYLFGKGIAPEVTARPVTVPSGIYPCHNFGPARYAETMQVVSVLTGTRSPLEDPAAWPAHQLEGPESAPAPERAPELGDFTAAMESAFERFEAAHLLDRMNDTTAMDMRGYFEGGDF
jgi:hypothetical protein